MEYTKMIKQRYTKTKNPIRKQMDMTAWSPESDWTVILRYWTSRFTVIFLDTYILNINNYKLQSSLILILNIIINIITLNAYTV